MLASVGILVLLGAVKHLGRAVPPISSYALTIVAAAQLYVPILLIGRRGITRESLGLTSDHWRRDLLIALGLGLLTIVPFAIGHHYWQTRFFDRVFVAHPPENFAIDAVSQVFAIALPEELFFRGYLQGRLELLWPAKRKLFATPFGSAILTASAVFALAHFVGEYRPDRLGPFFPALVFGLLRARTGSLVAPVTYHAFCNILSDVLFACYR
jgi:membrane protease YdiL (CAAX protease family)